MSRSRSAKSRRSAGFIMAFVLICLTIATVILVAMLQRVAIAHRQAELRQRQLQSQWIANSAVELAIAGWLSNEEYQGETWKIEADQLSGDYAGRAEIQLEPAEGNATLIRVVAIYPDQLPTGLRTETELLIPNEVRQE